MSCPAVEFHIVKKPEHACLMGLWMFKQLRDLIGLPRTLTAPTWLRPHPAWFLCAPTLAPTESKAFCCAPQCLQLQSVHVRACVNGPW